VEQIPSLSLYFAPFLILCDGALDFFVCFRDRSSGHLEKYYVPLKKIREKITSPKTIEETSGIVNLKTQLNSAKL
jgi:hypothetical protein